MNIKKQLLLFIIIIIICTNNIFATSFSANLDSIVVNINKILKIPKTGNYSISATEKDENYLIPVSSLYDLLSKRIRNHNNNFIINILDGENQRIAQSMFLKASSGGYADIDIKEAKVDSLIIGASLYISSKGKLTIQFVICDILGKIRFKSRKVVLSLKDPESEYLMDIFDLIEEPDDIEVLRYREKIIKKFNNQLMQDPNMTSGENMFTFKKDWLYANLDQVDAIEEVLRIKFGFSFNTSSKDKIFINRSGGVEFCKNGRKLEISRLVDVEPVLDDDFNPIVDSIVVPISDEELTDYAKVAIKKEDISVHQIIKETIEKDFASAYNRGDFKYLNKIFANNKRSVLRGKVYSNPKTGKEQVRYYWETKQQYLKGLASLVKKKKYQFDITLKLLSLYQENENRYWAVVRQNWKTKKRNGAVVYRDDGFLFINFDFSNGKAKPEMKIYYRIWIYNYKYANIELGKTRIDFIERDFNGVFFKEQASEIGGNGFYTSKGHKIKNLDNITVQGIDKNMLKMMRNDIIETVKKHDGLILGR